MSALFPAVALADALPQPVLSAMQMTGSCPPCSSSLSVSSDARSWHIDGSRCYHHPALTVFPCCAEDGASIDCVASPCGEDRTITGYVERGGGGLRWMKCGGQSSPAVSL
ncbi:hypothetical protein C8Q80DRAFT_460223 [Daedaleopsis nitida]|nr:hypothetical protein C8Q80DRAFT_460223 [Daedaleopsis nitida]